MGLAPVFIVDGARTPFLKARNAPGPFSAADLALQVGRSLLLRQPFLPSDLDEVIVGCASPAADEMNIARVLALRLGCGHSVPAWTVMRNCASGMQAIDAAVTNIEIGRAQLILAGGVDALSRTPLLYTEMMVRWFARMMQARKGVEKLRALLALRPGQLFKPVIGLLKGLTDPSLGLLMGQTAEHLAWRFGVSRTAMDDYSVCSHQRALAASATQRLAEIVPLLDSNGIAYTTDDGVRPEVSVSTLARLKPYFDRQYGRVTPGNSSQVSDGAALLILASQAAVTRWRLQPLGVIRDRQWAALDPLLMGLGPVHAATPILLRNHLGLDDVDLWEINEAFAAQVLACIAAWQSDEYCRQFLGLSGALGTLPRERLNVDGGAIAIGHPVGASGIRIVLHLLLALRASGRRRGMAAICIGGGQGGAMLVEAMS